MVISGGGTVGGVLVTLVAPLVLTDFYELHGSLMVVCGLVPIVLWNRPYGPNRRSAKAVWSGLALIAAAVTVVTLVYQIDGTSSDVVHQSRSFYGVTRVVDEADDTGNPRVRLLFSGKIRHGAQFLAPENQQAPTYYYAPTTGIGLVMRGHHADRPRRMGFVGLGAGTLAAYGKPDDRMIFYEINETVAKVAKEQFSFLTACQADWEVRIGDGRLLLERELSADGGQDFDVLVLDAFSGDSIPTHLLTYEAMGLYLNHLADHGMLAFHVTNQHFELTPVLADLAEKYELTAAYAQSQRDAATETAESAWVLMTRDAARFSAPAFAGLPLITRESLRNNPVAWTDDYCSLFSVMRPLFEHDPNKQLGEATTLARAGKLDEAEAILRKLVDTDENNHQAWFQLGMLMDFQQRRLDAAVAFAKVVELNPSPNAFHMLGTQIHQSNAERAMQCYQQAIRLDPQHVQSMVNLGVLLAQRNQLTQAKKLFLTAVQIAPGHEQATANLERIEQIESRQATTP